MMRISTSMMYDLGVGTVQQQFGDLQKLQQQLATGRRILNPSDDPIASARALEVSQSQSTNEQFSTNGDQAKGALSLQESTLSQVGDLLQNARVVAVNAGNPALSNSDRASLATELQGYYDQLMGLANTTDGNGQYLFSGYKGSTQPFTQGATGVNYNGDQGQRRVQISASRQVPVSSSGAEVFQLIKNGNGTFATSAAATNTGTGVVSPGVVTDPLKWNAVGNAKDYRLVFSQDTTVFPPVTSYDIVANVATVVNGVSYAAGSSLLTGAASNPVASATGGPRYPRTYVDGQAIDFKYQAGDTNPNTTWDLGIQVSISGQPTSTPTTGLPLTGADRFDVKASVTNQDLFSTLGSLITALKGPVTSSAGNARLTNDLNTALSNIDLGLDNILTVRAAVGSSLKEVETQRSTNDDLATQYKATLSGLQDLDFAKAISDMTLKQASLDAAQKSFVKVQGLSLFNYINP